jgi:hypothetical protein
MQIIHWFTNNKKAESEETMTLLDAEYIQFSAIQLNILTIKAGDNNYDLYIFLYNLHKLRPKGSSFLHSLNVITIVE